MINIFKKVFLATLVAVFLFSIFLPFSVQAEENPEINFFFSPTCPVCAQEKIFLDELENKYPEVIINRFDLSNRENYELLARLFDIYQVPESEQGVVPVTFIDGKSLGGQYFIGYGEKIDSVVEQYIQELIDGSSESTINQATSTGKISLPIIGEINLSGLSPLTLSVAVGALDGFNACAMVALGFLLAVLAATGVRKRVFIIGGTFILVSGLVYFLFIAAWLNLFLFLGYVRIITVVVSVIIIAFAVFLLRDFAIGVVCKICDVPEGKEGILTRWQRKLFVYLSNLTTKTMSLPLTLLGVSLVAAGINMIELFCSIGFPLAYTNILTSYGLSIGAYYGYLAIYILFYMIDDFLIFLIAVVTLRITKIGDKYLRAVTLISGIILLILGILMLVQPEWLIIK